MEEKPAPRSVEELMIRYGGTRPETAMRSFGLRLPPSDLASLEILSQRLGVAKSTLARDLMSAALKEAFAAIQFEDSDDEAHFYEFAAAVRDEYFLADQLEDRWEAP